MIAADLRRLLKLLDHEHAALCRADLEGLERLMPRKLALLERIETAVPADAPAVERLGRAARRNARLFQALIGGLTEARHLITALRDGARGQTYGRDGARALLEPPKGSLQRRR